MIATSTQPRPAQPDSPPGLVDQPTGVGGPTGAVVPAVRTAVAGYVGGEVEVADVLRRIVDGLERGPPSAVACDGAEGRILREAAAAVVGVQVELEVGMA